MSVFYPVCDSCSVAVENGDTSHMSHMEDFTGESELDTVLSNIELMGNVVRVGTYENGGYWVCSVCEYVTIGNGHEFELQVW